MIQDMMTKDMPAFMGNHCIQLLFGHHINQTGSDRYKNLCIAKDDKVVIQLIREITDHGDNVEIKRQQDGTLKIYAVRKSVVYK